MTWPIRTGWNIMVVLWTGAILALGPLGWADVADLRTVRDFGAVGDGVTDDTAAFRAALTRVRRVYVPAGRYRITGQLRVPEGGALVGEGTLVIEFGDGPPSTMGNTALLLQGDNCRIEGLTLEKRFVDGSYGVGIGAEGRRGVRIERVEISGYSARYGIHLIDCTDFAIRGCYIHDFMVNTAADMIQDSPAAIRVTRSVRGVISDNLLERIQVGPKGRASTSPLVPDYGPQGYQSDHLTLLQCRHVTMSGNILSTSGEGIDLSLSRSCTVVGNVIRDIWFEGIKMLGAAFCTVVGNHLADCFIGIGLHDHSPTPSAATPSSAT
jgi:parallel beta-helix repeat protein